MDGMIFAAGLGTRLGAVGRDTPKALIEVGGVTMLERTVRRLVDAGVDHVIVNVHHQADRVARFISDHPLGVEIELSLEPDRPLETGGGLLHARGLFRGGPFILHNVDIISDANLASMVAAHVRSGAWATLAVQERETSRFLLFDDAGLFGREDRRRDLRIESRPSRGAARALAFAGIHVCAPEILEHIAERGVFTILDTYLRLVAEGRVVAPWPLEGRLWLEIGNVARLEAARATIGRGASA